ncbi:MULTISPECIES: RDD family protein [unclassified Nocardiopsis]|uniref:RDD family protein n=1 Tax=Nocardiopsis TaxID=2013 RepID=UPI00387B9068
MTESHPGGAEPAGDTAPAGPGAEPAPVSLRAAARFIDIVLAATVVSALFALASLPAAALPVDGYLMSVTWMGLLLSGGTVLLFLYEWVFLVALGATPGKLMTGIAVVGPDGGGPGRGHAAVRATVLCLPQSLPCIGQCFTLVESMGALSPEGRTLHDRLAGTAVVRTSPPPPAEPRD